MKTAFKQTQKLTKNTGSFFNHLMSNNSSVPTPGEYCTFLHYTDRTVGIVKSFDEAKKECVIEQCHTIADTSKPGEMGHQDWIHTPNGQMMTLVYRNGAWRRKCEEIRWADNFIESVPRSKRFREYLEETNPEAFAAVCSEDVDAKLGLYKGITEMKRSFPKMNVLFNRCDYYYDWSF